jgi:hypothetical protein
MSGSLTLDTELNDDLTTFCKLNNIENVDEFKLQCFRNGYYILKYGLMNEDSELKPFEVTKEVVVEKDCEDLKSKLAMVTETASTLRSEIIDKDKLIEQQIEKINNLSGIITSKLARFHSTSNLRDTI